MASNFILVLSGVLFVIASLFSFVAAIGLLRLPDLYTRMHAASKAGTLGAGLMFLSLGIVAMDTGILFRALAGAAFLLLTAPVGAHLLARAAYAIGLEPWTGTAGVEPFEDG